MLCTILSVFVLSNIFMISGSSSGQLEKYFFFSRNILLTNTELGSRLSRSVWFFHIPFQRQTVSAGGLPLPTLWLLLSRATENVKTRLRIFTSQPENKYYGRLLQWILRRPRKRLLVYFDNFLPQDHAPSFVKYFPRASVEPFIPPGLSVLSACLQDPEGV